MNPIESNKAWAVRFLLLVAGLGGLLYGIDVGIIAGALPYLQATSGLTANQISVIVAAVLLGSIISTIFAGLLADLVGRKLLMILSGLLFVVSIPTIALAQGFGPLLSGRLVQGISAGLVGVAVPLYLAECLSAASRGKGTGVFQWLLTLGICAAAWIAIFFSMWLKQVEDLGDPDQLFAARDLAWRSIFWVSLPPGLLFVLGSLVLPESPRWLFRRGRKDAARAALLRTRTQEQADLELAEMEETAAIERAKSGDGNREARESLLSRKYVIPFLLACIILACTQATGVNSIIQYNAAILIQAGLSDVHAHWSNVIFTSVNFLVTIVGVLLVDRRGRKFLLSLGSAGIIVSLVCAGLMFQRTEKTQVECRDAVQAMVGNDTELVLKFDQAQADRLLAAAGDKGKAIRGQPATLVLIYSFGDFVSATNAVRSDDKTAKPIEIHRDPEIDREGKIIREGSLPTSKVEALSKNPLGDLETAKEAPLRIDNALVTPVPSAQHGWLTALCIFTFMAFFAVGPGVCVWLALSELMPTRIRSNGMSIALVLNQTVSTSICAVFLPTVAKYGYAAMFFAFAGFTVIYFVTAAFFLPETKGKTLEEIEEHFSGHTKAR
ncbi:MAG: MFS transporter [Thermoguttaceae bacterium]|jgi:MFS family permease